VHELAIAEGIVRIAAGHAGDRRVTKVELKVGYLRQVVPAALAFGFELVAQGTPVEGAELEIEEVPARVRCERCGAEGELDGFPLCCPSCGSLDVAVTAGEELHVEALEVDSVLTTKEA
jgi:hydrogenase nickel incorporation protein HypA/HybF